MIGSEIMLLFPQAHFIRLSCFQKRFVVLAQGLLISLGTGVCLGTPAIAADTVTLTFSDSQVTVPLSNLQSFAETGVPESAELQEFVQRHPTVTNLVQTVLAGEVFINPAIAERLRGRLQESSTVEFLVLQLSRFITVPSRPNNSTPIRTALRAAYEDDNRFSLLEIAENYPESNITINLTGLEVVYNDVKEFVERVLPALEVAKQYLQDLVCDCETVPETTAPETLDTPAETTPPATGTPQSIVPIGHPTERSAEIRSCIQTEVAQPVSFTVVP